MPKRPACGSYPRSTSKVRARASTQASGGASPSHTSPSYTYTNFLRRLHAALAHVLYNGWYGGNHAENMQRKRAPGQRRQRRVCAAAAPVSQGRRCSYRRSHSLVSPRLLVRVSPAQRRMCTAAPLTLLCLQYKHTTRVTQAAAYHRHLCAIRPPCRPQQSPRQRQQVSVLYLVVVCVTS